MSYKYQQQQNLPQAESREVLTSTLLLFKSIERTNQTVLGNGENFDQCVDSVFLMCPQRVKSAIVKRVKEYKQTSEKYVYTSWCGIQQGTVEHPVRNPETGQVISPIKVESEFVNYHELYNVILNELESAGYHYKTETMTYQVGSTNEKEPDIPLQRIEECKLFLQKAHDMDREAGYKYTLYSLVEKLLPPVPETPVFAEEQESVEATEGEAV